MRQPFDSQCYYHVFNRGVDKRVIFSCEDDFRRFYESMYLFNDENYRHKKGKPIEREVLLSSALAGAVFRKPLVRVVAFCLMRNHFHLLLRPCATDGIPRFLHKLGMGYAHYFNKRNERSGRLFESTYKAIPADAVEHLRILPRYIHLNGLDTSPIEWRTGELRQWEEARIFLDSYPWSSHQYYLGGHQDLPVVHEDEVSELFPRSEEYVEYLRTGPPLSGGPV